MCMLMQHWLIFFNQLLFSFGYWAELYLNPPYFLPLRPTNDQIFIEMFIEITSWIMLFRGLSLLEIVSNKYWQILFTTICFSHHKLIFLLLLQLGQAT